MYTNCSKSQGEEEYEYINTCVSSTENHRTLEEVQRNVNRHVYTTLDLLGPTQHGMHINSAHSFWKL